MDLSQLASWAIAHPELAVVAAGAVLSIPGAVYAVVKTAYQAITGRPAKGRVWTVLDVIAEVLPNLPGAVNRAVRGAGVGARGLGEQVEKAEKAGECREVHQVTPVTRATSARRALREKGLGSA